jgi:two-component system response regulator YesN
METINIVIADDESIIRQGMVKLLNWEKMGFNIIGLASDGEQALSMIEEKPVDILITDIKMPFLEGLELIREVKNIKPELICLILTGYDEFIYAKKSLELGAYAYILKPVEPLELTRLLYKAKEKIKNRTDQEKYIQNLEAQLRNNENSSPKDKSNETIIQKITKYIDKNFCDPNISLYEVSKRAGYEPTYFSKLFKWEKGINFVNYLIDHRMQKAQELLRRKISPKDVCEMVGYENYSHFSTLFKKKVGKSPKQFLSTPDE